MCEKIVNHWICDVCGKVIESAEQGVLEWSFDPGLEINCKFLITHTDEASPLKRSLGCAGYPHPSARKSGNLAQFLGIDGLGLLLSLLNSDPFIAPMQGEMRRENLQEWVNVVMRLHIPYYEEARKMLPDWWAKTPMQYKLFGPISAYSPEYLKDLIWEGNEEDEDIFDGGDEDGEDEEEKDFSFSGYCR